MPAYQYEAAYASGERVTGIVEAVNKNEAVAQIRQSCEIVISLTEIKTVGKDPLEKIRKVDYKSLSMTCRQFAIILKAGLPLVQTVDLVAGQTTDKTLSKMLRQTAEDVSNGWSLSYSFSQRGGKLPVTFRETIRAGEESGDLIGAFHRMSLYFDRMHKTKSKAASALVYPIFVIVAAVIVVGVIMIYAVPTFSSTFAAMNIELPGITKSLIAVSNFMTNYIWLLLAAIAALLFGLRLYGNTENGARRYARIKLAIPIIGKINQMAGASQFAHTMSTMLSAGMPILQAIEISGQSMTNVCMSEEVLETISGVEAGHSLGVCMHAAKDLPPMLAEMTTMGETTGSLESTLNILAEYYDNEVDTLTTRALSLLEPMIICILAFIVVLVLMSVYLPMFSMYGTM